MARWLWRNLKAFSPQDRTARAAAAPAPCGGNRPADAVRHVGIGATASPIPARRRRHRAAAPRATRLPEAAPAPRPAGDGRHRARRRRPRMRSPPRSAATSPMPGRRLLSHATATGPSGTDILVNSPERIEKSRADTATSAPSCAAAKCSVASSAIKRAASRSRPRRHDVAADRALHADADIAETGGVVGQGRKMLRYHGIGLDLAMRGRGPISSRPPHKRCRAAPLCAEARRDAPGRCRISRG